MKKIVLIIFLSLVLASCWNKKEDLKIEIEKNTNTWVVVESKEKENKIKWLNNEKYNFKCFKREKNKDNLNNLVNKEDIEILQKKVNMFNDMSYYDNENDFARSVLEYCKTEDSKKYVFLTTDKPRYVFWRYDKDLDIIEPAIFKYKTFDDIRSVIRIYWSNIKLGENKYNWFWKREWDNILINDFWRPINKEYKELDFFLKEKNKKYCYNWLTSGWKRAFCFADTYYKYNFIENILKETKICTYYFDDNWNKQVLESCKEFDY